MAKVNCSLCQQPVEARTLFSAQKLELPLFDLIKQGRSHEDHPPGPGDAPGRQGVRREHDAGRTGGRSRRPLRRQLDVHRDLRRVLFVWMGINSWLLVRHPFDPYPFILLNLVLSTIAALQAPVIMMSQNRQAEKDRMQANQDYQINLMAEMEIRDLHDKLDGLRNRQGHEL
jgi:hypothetical protein